MTGRRRHQRHVVHQSEGTLDISREVTVHYRNDGDFIVTSHHPGCPGEVLTLEIASEGARMVRVEESRPVVVRGSIRHRLRVTPLQAERGAKDADGGPHA